MAGRDDIREHMDVIGADGVHVGTVDKVEGDRIKLTKADRARAAMKATTISSRATSSPASKATKSASAPMATWPMRTKRKKTARR